MIVDRCEVIRNENFIVYWSDGTQSLRIVGDAGSDTTHIGTLQQAGLTTEDTEHTEHTENHKNRQSL